MSLDSVSDWSTTAASNVDVGGINIQGSASIANGDNALREIMEQIASYTRRGSDLASAGTLNLDSIDSLFLNVTGTTTVTAVTLTSTHWRIVRATGAFQMTASASLIVNGSTTVNYTTVAGDYLLFEGYAASVVRVSVIGRTPGAFLPAIGTAGQILRVNSGATAPEWTSGLAPDIILQDQKAANTDGGGASAATTQTRTLNTEVRDLNGDCSLSGNQFTLTAGTYRCEARAPAAAVDRHRAFIYNVTDGTTVLTGRNAYSSASDLVVTDAVVSGVFTVAASKALDLRHYTQAAAATYGLGVKINDGFTEIYSEVKLWKIT